MERSQIDGWIFEEIPINQAAERTLVADRIVNGEFRSEDGAAVRVFSAKRYTENPNEIGLFVHTPDRCWVEAGWKFEPAAPDFIEIDLHGWRLKFERRIFHYGDNKELVYFCGLVDGQSLPYRLDHNLALAARSSLNDKHAPNGTPLKPVSNLHFWRRLWDSLSSRRPLSGPTHFLRISTPIAGHLEQADRRLHDFLAGWLALGGYTGSQPVLPSLRSR